MKVQILKQCILKVVCYLVLKKNNLVKTKNKLF